MTKRKMSPRALRREGARIDAKLGRARERLAHLEPGGDPSRPVEVRSASQIEPHAIALACLRCDGPIRLEEHAALTVGAQRLRLAKLACPRCGARRDIWFRIVAPQLN